MAAEFWEALGPGEVFRDRAEHRAYLRELDTEPFPEAAKAEFNRELTRLAVEDPRLRNPLELCAKRKQRERAAERKRLGRPDPKQQLNFFSPQPPVDLSKVRDRIR